MPEGTLITFDYVDWLMAAVLHLSLDSRVSSFAMPRLSCRFHVGRIIHRDLKPPSQSSFELTGAINTAQLHEDFELMRSGVL